MTEIWVYQLGLVEYATAFRLQDTLQSRRIEGEIPDVLLLLEHPPTLTLAKGDDEKNILVGEQILKQRNVAVFPTDRGGSITFHGPGQIVGYPILNLAEKGRDVHQYIRNLEQVIMETLKMYRIESRRDADHVGVWVGNEKIAAIGVRIKKWVTKHGFALNVNSDLSYFDLINPCGIVDKGVTSMKNLLNRSLDMEAVFHRIIQQFASVFNVSVNHMNDDEGKALLDETD